MFPKKKTFVLNCTTNTKGGGGMLVTNSRFNRTVTKVMQRTVHAAILLAVCESRSCH